jgi:hypothetical protein
MSKITEDTSVKTDIKTIGSLIAAAGFAVYMYIGMTNTINTLRDKTSVNGSRFIKKGRSSTC